MHPDRPSPARAAALGVLIPTAVRLLCLPAVLRMPLNVYDEGLYLTIARFTGLRRLPYRDLWSLYGPGTSVLGPVLSALFGRQLVAFRIVEFVVSVLLVAGVYKLAQEFVAWWFAAALASVVATVAMPPFHFTRALALVVWGMWFVHRADRDRDSPDARRLCIGCGLIGLSFLGRYEFALVAAGLMLALWAYLWRRIDLRTRTVAVVVGLCPPALFGLWVLVTVPSGTLAENFYTYPMTRYPEAACRGLPTFWGDSFRALIAPLTGSLWDGRDVVLIFGNLVPLLAGVGLVALALWRRGRDGSSGAAMLLAGLLNVVLFYEMRTRSGAAPEPAVPIALVSAAMAIGVLARRWAKVATGTAIAGAAVFAGAMAVTWVRPTFDSFGGWPSYDSVLAYTSGTPDYAFYRPRTLRPIAAAVRRYTGPGEPIFVALRDNRGHYANAASLYWVLDRPPASRFLEFNPCLTDRNDIQRAMVQDLRSTKVVVQSTFFPKAPPPSGPATVLDDYLRANYVQVAESRLDGGGEAYFVLVRRDVPGRTPG